MKSKIVIGLIVLVIAGVAVYTAMNSGGITRGVQNATSTASTGPIGSGVEEKAISQIKGYSYTTEYKHPVNNFSFKHPSDFTVSSVPSDEGEAILVQNLKTKVGVQILVTPFDGEDVDVTKEYVESNIPDLKITDSQTVEIGANRKGLAFLSDNQSFGGNSREVWFVFKGNLYQISTYAELDEFLKGIFSTWKFL